MGGVELNSLNPGAVDTSPDGVNTNPIATTTFQGRTLRFQKALKKLPKINLLPKAVRVKHVPKQYAIRKRGLHRYLVFEVGSGKMHPVSQFKSKRAATKWVKGKQRR